jgi:catechol 2,3-dioxygenase-like lactoylglutathione lyase family enzyme
MFGDTYLHPVLAASDIGRAREWYSQKLGLEPVSEGLFGELRYELGGAHFLVYQSQFAGTNEATAAGFQVDDFDDVIKKLRQNNVSFEHVDFGEMGSTVDGVIASPDGKAKAAWFKDSEGNILSLSTVD